MSTLQKTAIDGVWMWSRWQPERGLNFNSFLVRGDESIVVDPLACDEDDLAAIRATGSVEWVVVTNRDHERASRAVASALGARVAAPAIDVTMMSGPVDRELRDGDVIGPGLVVSLEGLKSPGEFALFIRDRRTVIVGDALWGDPPGTLRMLPDDKLGDATRAVMSLRRIRAVQPLHLLVGDGACLFGNALDVLQRFFDSRMGVCPNKVNADELDWRHELNEPPPFGGSMAEIGFVIGARRLGYRLTKLAPGVTFCPFHWHAGEEELFIVLEGTPTLRTPQGEFACRPGDYIAFPVGAAGAHSIRNGSTSECTLVMLSNYDPDDICHYPDSDKVLIENADLMLRCRPELDYYDGEVPA